MSEPLRVLNVNDQVAARYLVSQMLQRSGFLVSEAETGQEALDRAGEGPDAIVLDLKLPDIDGYEVARRLKGSALTAAIPIVLTSAAFVNTEHRVEGLDSGADAYLAQPFELAELSATIRALIRTRSAEKRARDALRARDDFLSVASHELKTPLTSLSLQAQSLDRLWRTGRFLEVPPETVGHKIEQIARHTSYLATLIDDLLDVSRIRAGRLELRPAPVDLAACARTVVSRLESEIQRFGCVVTIDAPQPVFGSWDPARMDQIVTNFVTNALKYGKGSPVEVRVRNDAHDLAVIEVTDQGIGISPEDQERIFERFERASVDVNRPGLGLGLWIVKQLVAASGGDISVSSTPGQGSTFTVRLRRGGIRSGEDQGK